MDARAVVERRRSRVNGAAAVGIGGGTAGGPLRWPIGASSMLGSAPTSGRLAWRVTSSRYRAQAHLIGSGSATIERDRPRRRPQLIGGASKVNAGRSWSEATRAPETEADPAPAFLKGYREIIVYFCWDGVVVAHQLPEEGAEDDKCRFLVGEQLVKQVTDKYNLVHPTVWNRCSREFGRSHLPLSRSVTVFLSPSLLVKMLHLGDNSRSPLR
jgi:hypothetical protein